MGAKWLWGIIILAVLSLVWAFSTAPKRSDAMGEDIRNALRSAGSNAEVNMSGNVATLTGVAQSDAEMANAKSIAENTECTSCNNSKKFFFAKQASWHKVKNEMSLKAMADQSPYTFNATKDADGNIVLDGFVRNEDERVSVLAQANALFPGKVTNRTVRIAPGSPNADWGNVLSQNLDDLNRLDTGRFAMKDKSSVITGMASSTDVRDGITARASGLSNYNGSAKITVLDTGAEALDTCQQKLDDVKVGKKINFASNKDVIRGAQSFDLLNELAKVAKECAAFRINVEGHTDADGAEAYNQRLSEARANTVVAYLTENGITRERMQAIGFGEAKPIGDNATREGKALNRRIEFVVTQSK